MIITASPQTTGIDWTVVFSAVAPVFVLVAGWLLNKRLENRKLELQNRQMWALRAAELNRLHVELALARADRLPPGAPPVRILAPVKAFREILKTLEHYDRTGEWTKDLEKQGLLNVADLHPRLEQRE